MFLAEYYCAVDMRQPTCYRCRHTPYDHYYHSSHQSIGDTRFNSVLLLQIRVRKNNDRIDQIWKQIKIRWLLWQWWWTVHDDEISFQKFYSRAQEHCLSRVSLNYTTILIWCMKHASTVRRNGYCAVQVLWIDGKRINQSAFRKKKTFDE